MRTLVKGYVKAVKNVTKSRVNTLDAKIAEEKLRLKHKGHKDSYKLERLQGQKSDMKVINQVFKALPF